MKNVNKREFFEAAATDLNSVFLLRVDENAVSLCGYIGEAKRGFRVEEMNVALDGSLPLRKAMEECRSNHTGGTSCDGIDGHKEEDALSALMSIRPKAVCIICTSSLTCGSDILSTYGDGYYYVFLDTKFHEGEVVRFNTHGADSEWNDRSGSRCVVVRPLTEDEADIADVGPMYAVKFPDGIEIGVFEDEIAHIRTQAYAVTVKETLERTVTIEAETPEEAIHIAEKNWKNQEYILSADDFTGVEYSIAEKEEN